MNRLNFSKEQLQAIYHYKGPALVIAGPGSGKTAVIVNRILYLIQNKHINPYNILSITFSKMAAVQMQARFNQLSDEYYPVSFGTFHSVFFNIIKQTYGYNGNNIISENEKRRVLSDVLSNFTSINNIENEFLDSVLKRIAFYKNSSMKTDNSELCDMNDNDFMSVFDAYNMALKAQSKIDFEDMMLQCLELLQNNVAIRRKYQQLFRFIFVDEFQDINNLQFDILRLILSEENNLFAVGDDDQSIYGFRGSDPQIMGGFGKYFENSTIIRMSCNYRSTKCITRVASVLISENKTRYAKNIYTNNDLGNDVVLKGFIDYQEEMNNITDYLKQHIRTNSDETIGILFRTNITASNYISHILKMKIPCNVREKVFNPYKTAEFRDFVHYLNLAEQVQKDQIEIRDFIPVMNKPLRYIGRKYLNGKYVDLTYLKGMYKEQEYIVKNIKKFEYDLKQIGRMDIYSAWNYFRRVIGYDDYMKLECKGNKNKFNDYMVMADALMESLDKIANLDELIGMIDEISELSNKTVTHDIKEKGIYIMTYHASKGLEFDTVFIPGLMEGEVPGRKCSTEQSIEEERRMLYVAMTRARKNLFMSYIAGKGDKKLIFSRFLYPLLRMKDCISY